MEKKTVSDGERVELRSSAAVEVPDGSRATVVIRPSGRMKVDLALGRGCRVDSFVIQEEAASLEQRNHVGPGSVINTSSVWLSGGEGKVENSLEGEGAKAYDLHVFVERGENRLHLDSVLRHAEKGTKGNILVKGIARESGSARLDGMIKIEKNGGGAESFLSEHVMLLNPGAHATANPELEIENNDVQSRHAASVSRIDEEKIFYLMSRGISREDSKKLIVEGFLESALERIEDPEMRKELTGKVMAAV